MAETVASGSVKNLLRRSRFASYMNSVGQVYTTPEAQLKTGDWGVKHSLLATPVGARPNSNTKLRNLTLPEVDSLLGLSTWKSAERGARFVRMWGGSETALRMKPEKGLKNWSTDNGKVPEPWALQGERIVVSRETLARRQQEEAEAWRREHEPTDAELKDVSRERFLTRFRANDEKASALFDELWAKLVDFVRVEGGQNMPLWRWVDLYGADPTFELELNNFQYEAEAKKSFFHPDSLASDPTEEDWQSIVSHAQKRRMSLSQWEDVVREIHRHGTIEDQALDRFVAEEAEAQLASSMLKGADRQAQVESLTESLKEDPAVAERFVAFVTKLRADGESLESWVGQKAGKQASERPAVKSESVFNPNHQPFNPDLVPDVERMSEAEFTQYLDSVKTLQPKYRQYLLQKMEAQQQAGREDTSLPTDTSLRKLQVDDTLLPVRESKEFARRHFAEAAHTSSSLAPQRHPTGGLQYSLASKLEMATAKPLNGYHLGRVPVGKSKDATLPLHSIGGLVVSGSPSTAIGGSGFTPIDLGLTQTGQWRTTTPRNSGAGKYKFRVERSVLADPPKVVTSKDERASPLEYSSISRGPDFQFRAAYPLSIEVSRSNYPAESTSATIRTSPLDAYGRGEKLLGSRNWVSGHAEKQARLARKQQAFSSVADVIRSSGRP